MMDVRMEFANEMITRALFNRLDNQETLLSTLMQLAASIDNGVKNVQNETEAMNRKMDIMLQKMEALENAFSELKNEARDLDQKIILMASKLDKIEKSIPEEDLEDYYELCQRMYNNWDAFEDLTRKLIPVAEYLFSSLQKYNKPDYSPVILELCRGIEAEFLFKIFHKYTLDLIERKGKDLERFLSTDKDTKKLIKETGLFVKAITNTVSSEKKTPQYTLGQMNMIMAKMTKAKLVAASPLLRDFKKYLERETVLNNLLNRQFISKINDLVSHYRNPAAHPGFIDIDRAKECKDFMPDRLDYLMDCLA